MCPHPPTPAAVPAAPLTSRHLSNTEAANFLNLSPRTLEKKRVMGDGPQFHKLGRRVVYSLADLEIWANARTCDSTSAHAYYATR